MHARAVPLRKDIESFFDMTYTLDSLSYNETRGVVELSTGNCCCILCENMVACDCCESH